MKQSLEFDEDEGNDVDIRAGREGEGKRLRKATNHEGAF